MAEQLVCWSGELRTEQVHQGDGAPTGLDHGHGLGGGQVATPEAGQQSQRLGHRLDGAQVGTRSDDDLAVGGAKGPDGLLEVTDRDRLVDAVGHVVGADQNDGDVGLGDLFQSVGELRVQTRGLGADDRDVGQPNRSPTERRDAVGDDRTDSLLGGVRAHPSGTAVAEHEELDRTAQPRAIQVVIVRGTLKRLAYQTPGELGLDLEHAIADQTNHADPGGADAAAIRGRCRDLACASCPTHAGPLSSSYLS